jgi:starch synthase
MKKVLFVTSETHPLIKTGGLADVSYGLPKALAELSQDVRIIMPNYQAIKTDQDIHFRCTIRIDNRDVNIQETRLPGSDVIVWLVDYPAYFGHPGNPYLDETGTPWADSAQRFALFCRIAVEVAMNRAYLDWHADIVHCNDWQSGLIPALLTLEQHRPATVFTIHNLAYQGLFPKQTFNELHIPGQLWSPEILEFFGMLSFIKGGLTCADRITTVSPTYALEIQTPEYGYGLEGLLSHRADDLIGIINGIDLDQWSPETDTTIARQYNATTLEQKQANKSALQQQASLPVDADLTVIGLIGRLVEQKGIDMVIDCLPDLADMPVQFILLGSGDKSYELRLMNLAHLYPDKISITLCYDEKFAHLIEAGADIFFMPSRFEPCGLNQMYSLIYGTIPIVRKTGGLADTVIDAIPTTIKNKSANGIVFKEATAGALLEAVKRALLLFDNKKTWKNLQQSAMKQDLSWRHSAQQYLQLYESISQ